MGETGLFSLAQVYPSFFFSRLFLTLVSNLILTFAGGANDEGPDGPLHGPKEASRPFEREG